MKDELRAYLTGVSEEREIERGRKSHTFNWCFDVHNAEGWQRDPMRALRRYAHGQGVRFVVAETPQWAPKGARGFLIPDANIILISNRLDACNAFHVALHELTHYLTEDHFDRVCEKGARYGTAELTAEGVAYMLSQRYLTPTTRASLEYGALLAPPSNIHYTQALRNAVPQIVRVGRILHGELERYDGG